MTTLNELILTRYLEKKCNSGEMKKILEWLSGNQANADRLFEMERLWMLKDEARYADPQIIDRQFDGLQAKIAQSSNRRHEFKPQRIALVPFLRYAAAAAILILLSVNLFYMISHREADYVANTIEVPKGQRVTLALSDGTKVWLNSQSTLTYPSRFSQNNRKVQLQGEGYFEVAKDQSKPFIVETSLLNVKVIGTKFDMRAYPDEDAFVTLTEGEVEVATPDARHLVRLLPSEQVTYSATQGMKRLKNINTEPVKAWTVGELSFHNTTLAEIVKVLERRFDVQITVSNEKLASDKFTCHFSNDVTIEQIMHNLKDTKRLSYKINNRKIEITDYL